MRKPNGGVSDSTVADKEDDVCSVNSDPLNSSSSEYSYTASPPSFEPVLHEDSHRLAPAQHSLNDSGCHVTSPQPSLPSPALGLKTFPRGPGPGSHSQPAPPAGAPSLPPAEKIFHVNTKIFVVAFVPLFRSPGLH